MAIGISRKIRVTQPGEIKCPSASVVSKCPIVWPKTKPYPKATTPSSLPSPLKPVTVTPSATPFPACSVPPWKPPPFPASSSRAPSTNSPPFRRRKYAVENTRVGQRPAYDKLIPAMWTDGRLTPDEALRPASAILRHPLDLFADFANEVIEFAESQPQVSQENSKLKKLLNMSV